MDLEQLLIELGAAIAGTSVENAQAVYVDWYDNLGIFGFLWDFCNGCLELISSLGIMIGQLVSDLPYIISVVTDFLGNIPLYFSWLPTEVISLLCAVFGVVATYMIVGRE